MRGLIVAGEPADLIAGARGGRLYPGGVAPWLDDIAFGIDGSGTHDVI